MMSCMILCIQYHSFGLCHDIWHNISKSYEIICLWFPDIWCNNLLIWIKYIINAIIVAYYAFIYCYHNLVYVMYTVQMQRRRRRQQQEQEQQQQQLRQLQRRAKVRAQLNDGAASPPPGSGRWLAVIKPAGATRGGSESEEARTR